MKTYENKEKNINETLYSKTHGIIISVKNRRKNIHCVIVVRLYTTIKAAADLYWPSVFRNMYGVVETWYITVE